MRVLSRSIFREVVTSSVLGTILFTFVLFLQRVGKLFETLARIFAEQFPNKVLYVGDVVPGPVARWRNVFLADLTPAEERTNEGHDRSEEPRITVASEALAVPDVPRNLIQLTMLNQYGYEVGK